MDADLFSELARRLGRDPAQVLSIRVNAREAVVTYIDDAGLLASTSVWTAESGPAGSSVRCGPEHAQ